MIELKMVVVRYNIKKPYKNEMKTIINNSISRGFSLKRCSFDYMNKGFKI